MLDEEKAMAILSRFSEDLRNLTLKMMDQCRIAGVSVEMAIAISSSALMNESISNEFLAASPDDTYLDKLDEERYLGKAKKTIEIVRGFMAAKEKVRVETTTIQ